MIIDNELLAAYAEGNVSHEEREAVRRYLAANPDKMESVLFAMDQDDDALRYDDDNDALRYDDDALQPVLSLSKGYDDYIHNLGAMLDDIAQRRGACPEPVEGSSSSSSSSSSSPLPMTAMAAQNTIDHLCAVRCEGIALRSLGIDVTDEQLLKESEQEGWLQPQGTALHNIGRLSGTRGLSVSHRYHCGIHDIQAELSAGNVVIAAIDAGELLGTSDREMQQDIETGCTPNHVVIAGEIRDGRISITDSATPSQHDVYPLSRFVEAWSDSSNYLIVISASDDYTPHPINLDDVEVEDELIELREAIAENAHEVWADTRRREGWTYGPMRDDAKKQHPDMLPYNRLPESEKEYDRIMAMNTIKLVKKLGWEFRKK